MKNILAVLIVLIISQVIFPQTKFVEYGILTTDDESGILVAVANEFSKNKDSKVYILHTKEKKISFGRFLRRINGVAGYLNLYYKVPKESIISDASREEQDSPQTEIWFIEKEGKLPIVDKMSLSEKLKERITKITLFDDDCTDCSPTVNIDEGIFYEGLDYLSTALKANPTAKALLKIQRVEFWSVTIKQRNSLTKQIIKRLKDNNIQPSRFEIQFPIRIDKTKFYLIPNLKKK